MLLSCSQASIVSSPGRKGTGVCLLECYHFQGTEQTGAWGSPKGTANSLCSQKTSIAFFFSAFTIAFYFALEQKPFPSPSCVLVEAILEVPRSVLQDIVVRFHNIFKGSLLKIVTSGEP